MRLSRGSGSLFGVALLVALVATPALATFNGQNGRIAYSARLITPTPQLAIFGGDGRQLSFPNSTPPVSTDSDPAYSPDGALIAYARLDGPLNDSLIRIMGADGSDDYAFLSSDSISEAAVLSSPTWSADGQQIAFNVSVPGNYTQGGVFVIDADGTNLRRVWANESNSEQTTFAPQWSPAGRKIAFKCRRRNLVNPVVGQSLADDLCTFDTNNNQFRFLPITFVDQGVTKPLTFGRVIVRPNWTPDGQKLVFVSSHTSTDTVSYSFPSGSGTNNTYGIAEIFSVRADGTGLTRLTRSRPVAIATANPVVNAERLFQDVFVSPDGEVMVAVGVQNTPSADGYVGIWTMRANGSGQTLLKKSPPTSVNGFFPLGAVRLAWQPIVDSPAVYATDGHGNPLDGLKVELHSLSGDLVDDEPVHINNGTYVFEDVGLGSYVVKVTLEDAATPEPAFDIRHAGASPDEPAWIEAEVDFNSATLLKSLPFADGPGILGSNVPLEEWDHLDDLANIYFNTSRYVAWVKRTLQADTGPTAKFYAFAANDPLNNGKAVPPLLEYYKSASSIIVMGTSASEYENRDHRPDPDHGDDDPENGEWHEFTHHLTHHFVRPLGDCPLDLIVNVNHRGYLNPTSCDSLNEGLAMLFPATAASNITGEADSWYSTLIDLEDHTKANDGDGMHEDLAVPAVLWDFLDANVDSEVTQTIDASGVHRLVTLRDDVTMPVSALWTKLTTGHPLTVFDLHSIFATPATGSAAINVNLDGVGVADVSPIDLLFLMHGFYDAIYDSSVPANHRVPHYDVAAAQRENAFRPRNAEVGSTDHFIYDAAGNQLEQIERQDTPFEPNARIEVQVRDASGAALSGATVHIERPSTGFLTTTNPPQRFGPSQVLETGEGLQLHYEPPYYVKYPLADDAPLPPCSDAGVNHVAITVSATLNGYASINQPTFDNCEFWNAVEDGIVPAVAVTLSFPADSTPAVTTAVTALVPAQGSTASRWSVDLSCSDPVVGGFASGCARTEYRIDGGPILTYDGTAHIPLPAFQIEYRSIDAASNEEPFRIVQFDSDADGLPDAAEAQRGTDPNDPDSDDDGRTDGAEVNAGTNPLSADSDGDGLDDGAEFVQHTDPLNPDTDGDGLTDGAEITAGTDPLTADTDRDGIPDGPDNCKLRDNVGQGNFDEDALGNACDNCSRRTNPDQRDTDDDGYGNACDPDFNFNFRVDSNDASLLKAKLGSTSAPDQDLDGNGIVDASDMAILKVMFGQPPGPARIFD